MQCSFCGGEVNLSIGRCTKCGRWLDESSDVRIVRNVEELAKEYNIMSPEEKAQEAATLPALLVTKPPKEEFTEADDISAGLVRSEGPLLGRDDYERLMGVTLEQGIAAENGENTADAEQTHEQEQPEYDTPERQLVSSEDPLFILIVATVRGAVKGFFGAIVDKLKHIMRRVDAKLSGRLDKVLALYHKKVPQLKRAKQSTLTQRIILGAVMLVAAIGLVFAISAIASGEWLITETGDGEQLTWEFTGSGKVTVRTYRDDVAHVYSTGTYKKKRQNEHNMLTITYEDGSTTRLYYDIHRRTGTFTNVDSNRTAEYKRIR